MRTNKEIERMLGRVVNAAGYIKGKNKNEKQEKDRLYSMMQILNWLIMDKDEEINKRLIEKIALIAKVLPERI